jgi:hypothetical protein
MSPLNDWTRRQFLSVSGAAAAQRAVGTHPFARLYADLLGPLQEPALDDTESASTVGGTVQPLLEGHIARPMRYLASANDFVIRNGTEFFNRPLYGPISDYRVDAGDLPEFSLYIPGHGGNLKLGVIAPNGSKWFAEAATVVARYKPGRMVYEIHDPALGSGTVTLTLMTGGKGSTLLLKIEGKAVPAGVQLAWAYGGSSGHKGKRRGDIGGEDLPISQYFQLKADDCTGNQYILQTSSASGTPLPACQMRSTIADILLTFPFGAQQSIQDFTAWSQPPSAYAANATTTQPVLTGHVELRNETVYLTLQRTKQDKPVLVQDTAAEFTERTAQLDTLAATLRTQTPDPYLDLATAALSIAADALFDPKSGSVMGGVVAGRSPSAGWRGPYAFDAIGEHSRTREHLRYWLRSQNVSPVTSSDPATGPFDADSHMSAKKALLNSNGDISNTRYNMNQVFFDVLIRHLRWTGDMTFAQEAWPFFQRHIAWQHRLFRRNYTLTYGRHLPLYEGYGAIWAGDGLQYNGGGTTYASAYHHLTLRTAATLATSFHQDPVPYQEEADQLRLGMLELLWQPEQGAFAESRDLNAPSTVYTNPGLWTAYHAVDSEVPTPRMAWQLIAERLHTLRRVPVSGEGVPPGDWYLLPSTNWLPYQWSSNVLAMAENAHMALALWQAGMPDDAYKLLKGNLLDSMFQGLCPGNFHMTSGLDVYRQEQQRDWGDAIGITARAIVEGLFGVQPDLIKNQITIHPGFPTDWNSAALHHKDFDLVWNREGLNETYEFTSRFPGSVPVLLKVPARTTRWPVVSNGSEGVRFSFDATAVGSPVLEMQLPAAPTVKISIQWSGQAPTVVPAFRTYRLGVQLDLPPGATIAQIDDPQKCLKDGKSNAFGIHTVFANMHQDNAKWSLPITFEVKQDAGIVQPVPRAAKTEVLEAVDLSAVLNRDIKDIFTRGYTAPRPTTCSLAVPDTLLGTWTEPLPPFPIDDTGLRNAGGTLKTTIGVSFRTPPTGPNCAIISHFQGDTSWISVPVSGSAKGVYLLMTGTTLPQASRMDNGYVTALYADQTKTTLPLRNPDTWWPIEQDYLLDDYAFINTAPLPPRVELRNGKTRVLETEGKKGKVKTTPGGAATILYLPLDPARKLASIKLEAALYGVVVSLLGITLIRPS